MTNNRQIWMHLLFPAIIAISLALGVVQPVFAQELPPSDNIPAGQVIEGDRILIGQNITVDGNVTGDLFAIGGNVNINGEIGGSLYILAESVTINGKINGSVYQLAVEHIFDSASNIDRNVYLAGLTLETKSGARVNNDLFAASVNAWLSGDVGRYLRSVIVFLSVDGKIGLGPEEEEAGDTQLRHTITLVRFDGTEQTRLDFLPALKLSAAAQSSTSPALNTLIDYARKLITLLAFGGLTTWLFPKHLAAWKETARQKPFPSGGWGVIVLIVVVMITIVLTSIIPALGILLWKATLWGLASFVLSFGFTALGLAFIIFLITLVYISKVIVAYLIGDQILRRITGRGQPNMFGALFLGAALYMLLRFLPFVGWFIGVVVSLLGLGALWLAQRDSMQPDSQAIQPTSEETLSDVDSEKPQISSTEEAAAVAAITEEPTSSDANAEAPEAEE